MTLSLIISRSAMMQTGRCGRLVAKTVHSILARTRIAVRSKRSITTNRGNTEEKIWKSPFPPVAVCTEPLHEKFFRAIENTILRDSNRVALVSGEDPNRNITYRQLKQETEAVAAYLNSHGFQHGDVAAFFLPNGIEFATSFLGVLKCGGTFTAASPSFTEYEMAKQLKDSNSKVIVTHENFLKNVLAAAKSCPNVQRIICVRNTSTALPDNVVDFNTILKQQPFNYNYSASPSDLAFLPYSSGTTGAPKGVMLTNQSLGTVFDSRGSHMNKIILPHCKDEQEDFDWSKSNQLLQLPFFHVYGFGLLCNGLLEGSTGVFFSHFEPNNSLRAAQDYKVRCMNIVPPIFLFLAKHPMVNQFDLSSLRYIVTGAAPTGTELIEELSNRMSGVMITQGYGLSEISLACTIGSCESRISHSVGRPLATFEMKIIDPETGKSVGENQKGEVCFRGPCVMKGYLNRPEQTAEVIRDGWFYTGDIGYVDDKGDTYLIDRMKELIKVKGLQVAPAELEDVLLSCPGVTDAAVIGIPDERTGEAPKEFVVRNDEFLSKTQVQKFIEGRLSVHKHLRGGVVFVDSIPKSPSGKILRRVLRDEEMTGK